MSVLEQGLSDMREDRRAVAEQLIAALRSRGYEAGLAFHDDELDIVYVSANRTAPNTFGDVVAFAQWFGSTGSAMCSAPTGTVGVEIQV